MINKKFVLFIFLILLVFGILVVFVFDVDCIFKSIFGISCPSCGLTRGFRALFSGDIVGAISYNILTIPIFIFFVIFVILFVVDFFRNSDYVSRYLLFFGRHYVLLIICVIISFIVNNIRGI